MERAWINKEFGKDYGNELVGYSRNRVGGMHVGIEKYDERIDLAPLL